MADRTALSKVAMHITRGCLVVPIQGELADELVLQVQEDVLEKVKETGIKGVIIDVSGVNIIDSFLAQEIFGTAKMASVLGATAVITGLKPEVVASLIDFDFEPGDIQTAITLEDGFQRLSPIVEPPAEEAEEEVDYTEEQVEDSIAEDQDQEDTEEQEYEADEDEDYPDNEDDLLEEEPADED